MISQVFPTASVASSFRERQLLDFATIVNQDIFQMCTPTPTLTLFMGSSKCFDWNGFHMDHRQSPFCCDSLSEGFQYSYQRTWNLEYSPDATESAANDRIVSSPMINQGQTCPHTIRSNTWDAVAMPSRTHTQSSPSLLQMDRTTVNPQSLAIKCSWQIEHGWSFP